MPELVDPELSQGDATVCTDFYKWFHAGHVLLIANWWTAKELTNEHRDCVMLSTQHSRGVSVQTEKSFGPVYAVELCLASGPTPAGSRI